MDIEYHSKVKELIIERLKKLAQDSSKKDKVILYRNIIEYLSENRLDYNFVISNQSTIIEIIEDLKESRIIVQGKVTNVFDPNYLLLTDFGIDCLLNNAEYIYDPEEFISKLKKEVIIDDVVLFYFIECVRAFKSNFNISSSVCLGAASEKKILDLIDNYINSSIGKSLKNKWSNRWGIHRKFEEFKKSVITNTKNPIKDIEYKIEKIDSLFKNIKENRNDAGHPSGRLPDRDELICYIRVFHKYAKVVYELKEKFEKSK